MLLPLLWSLLQHLQLQSEKGPCVCSIEWVLDRQLGNCLGGSCSLLVSPPFSGLQVSSSSRPQGSCRQGNNTSGVGFLGIVICAFRISFLPILQKDVTTFCPSTGQDPAGVGNEGPNPRHQTERDRKGKRDSPG